MAGQLKLAFVIEALDKATAHVTKIIRNIDKLAEPARRISRAYGVVREQFAGIASVGLKIGAVAGAAAFAVGRVTSRLDALGDTADNIRVSSTRLQELRFTLEAAGGSGDQLDEAMTRLNANIGEAVNGNKELAQWFASVGVSMAQLRKSSPDQVLELISEFVHKLPETTRNTATLGQLSQAVFGRGGKTMLSFLRLGKEGMKQYADEAHRAGAVLSEETVKAFGDFNNVVERTKAGLFGALARAIQPALPALTKLLDKLGEIVGANQAVIGTKLEQWFSRLEQGLPKLFNELGDVWSVIKKVVSVADSFAQAIGGWGNALAVFIGLKAAVAVYDIAAAFGMLNVAMWANPAGVLLAVVLAIVAALPLMIKHWDTIIEKLYQVRQSVEHLFPQWMIDLNDRFLPSWAMPKPEGSWDAPAPAQVGRSTVGGTVTVKIDADGRVRAAEVKKTPGSAVDLQAVYAGGPLAFPV